MACLQQTAGWSVIVVEALRVFKRSLENLPTGHIWGPLPTSFPDSV